MKHLLIDNFFLRIYSTMSVLYQWLIIKKQKKIVIGLGAEIILEDIMIDFPHAKIGQTRDSVYCSFSSHSIWEEYDQYGVPDDEIFHYFTSIKAVLKQCISSRDEGWRIIFCRLHSAKQDLLDI